MYKVLRKSVKLASFYGGLVYLKKRLSLYYIQ